MTQEQIRAFILEVAYKGKREARGSGVGEFNVYKIEGLMEVPRKDIGFAVDYLVGEGWIELQEFGGIVKITPEGVNEYERTHEVQ